MPELTHEPDSIGVENQKKKNINKRNLFVEIFSTKVYYSFNLKYKLKSKYIL
jgi:hypothetical protein